MNWKSMTWEELDRVADGIVDQFSVYADDIELPAGENYRLQRLWDQLQAEYSRRRAEWLAECEARDKAIWETAGDIE